ncbi:hypothetical protein [Microbacterium sp.]
MTDSSQTADDLQTPEGLQPLPGTPNLLDAAGCCGGSCATPSA